MTIAETPAAEVEIDETLVRRLLCAQHPDLADRRIRVVAHGWDNALARLGDDLVARFPRRALAAPLVAHEQRWVPDLAPRLPLAIPVPLRVGLPGEGYPWAWSVCRWFEGDVAASVPFADSHAAMLALAEFVVALHRPAPADAPANPFRGVALTARDTAVQSYLELLGPAVDQATARRSWSDACALPPYNGPPLWIHGDLHPANLIVRAGTLAAVIDFGDVTAGDPSTDFAIAWMLFAPPLRTRFRSALGEVDDLTWRRARGNALAHGLACLARSADAPLLGAIGRRTVAAVLADDA